MKTLKQCAKSVQSLTIHTRTTSQDFTNYSGVSIIDFEQITSGWIPLNLLLITFVCSLGIKVVFEKKEYHQMRFKFLTFISFQRSCGLYEQNGSHNIPSIADFLQTEIKLKFNG